MNSWVPNWFGSVSSRQRPNRRGRFAAGPMPSRQWYLSAKQPPGQRTTTGPSRWTCSISVSADAVDVGDLRVGPDPDAVVDHAADVLGELAVDRRPDRADRLVQQHRDGHLAGSYPCCVHS